MDPVLGFGFGPQWYVGPLIFFSSVCLGCLGCGEAPLVRFTLLHACRCNCPGFAFESISSTHESRCASMNHAAKGSQCRTSKNADKQATKAMKAMQARPDAAPPYRKPKNARKKAIKAMKAMQARPDAAPPDRTPKKFNARKKAIEEMKMEAWRQWRQVFAHADALFVAK